MAINWQIYAECDLPIITFFVWSMICLLLIKIVQIYNVSRSKRKDEEQSMMNWQHMRVLKNLSSILVFGLLPVFWGLTVWGTILFVEISQESHSCTDIRENWPFFVFWLMVSYGVISLYFTVLVYGFQSDQKAKQARKSII
jgi:hypothetical protein